MEDLVYKNINISLIYSTFSYLWKYNIRRSKNPEFMEKIKKEKPLDDIIHTAYDNSIIKVNSVNMHKLCDVFAVILPLSVLIPEYKKIMLYRFFIELGIFQIYKQLICISTRLPPTGEPHLLSRKILGFTVGTTIDYGISGHASIPVLLFFHTKSYYALFSACLQSIISVISKDHYTLDVIHTWIFILAIYNRLHFLY